MYNNALFRVVFSLLIIGLCCLKTASAGSTEVDFLAENWSFNPFVMQPGYTEIGFVPVVNQFPEIVMDFSDGRWGIAGNDYGPNGYSIKWKSPVTDNVYRYYRMIYEDMVRLGRDQIVMIFRDDYHIYDRASRELVSTVNIDGYINRAVIADCDNDGDPDIFIKTSSDPVIKVFDLDTGVFLREFDQNTSTIAVGQIDDDPQMELICSYGENNPGYVIDLLTHEVQLVYEPGFGDYLFLGDLDLDGKDELIATNSSGFTCAIDFDTQTVKWQKQFFGVTDVLIKDLDFDGFPEVLIAASLSAGVPLTCLRGHDGETIWTSQSFCSSGVSLNAADTDLDGCMEIFGRPRVDYSPKYTLYKLDACSLELDWMARPPGLPFIAFDVGNIDHLGGDEIVICSHSGSPDVGYGAVIYIFDAVSLNRRCEIRTGDSSEVKHLFLVEVDNESPGMEMGIIKRRNLSLRNALTQDLIWETEYQIGCAVPADINGDGLAEIVATGSSYYSYNDHLVVYDGPSGTKEFESAALGASGKWMEIDDIDNDGILEIGVITKDSVYVFKSDSFSIDWTVSSNKIETLDFGDIMTETPGTEILYTENNKIWIVNGHDYSLISSFDLPSGHDTVFSLEVADVDGNGIPEILMQTQYYLYCMDSAGNVIWSSRIGIPEGTTFINPRNLVCRDLNGDGVKEVLFGSYAGFHEYRYGEASTPSPPACETTGVDLYMPASMFSEQDSFFLDAVVCNATDSVLVNHHVFIIMEAFGEYFCLPSWTEVQTGIDSYFYSIPPGVWQFPAVTMFMWPKVQHSADGLLFWGAITDPAVTQVIGEVIVITFGWM